MSVAVFVLPVLILAALALGVLVYYICYKASINRKLRGEESGAHVPMASMESVWKVVAVIAVFVMYSSLNSKIMNLQQEQQNTTNRLYDEIMELRYELEEMQETAKKEASMISEVFYDFGEVNPTEHTAEIFFSVVPKSYSEETEVSMVFRGEKLALMNNGRGLFTGSTIVPIFEDFYEKCMINITEGDVTKTEVWEDAPQGRQCFKCLPVLFIGGRGGSQMSKNSLRVEYEYELYPEYADSFRNVTLMVKKGDTIVDELEFVNNRVSIEQRYSIEKGEKGETIEFYIKGVDEYGYIHERLESTWDIGEGAGNEAYGTYDNRGYQIYAPDGTLLTQ